MSYEEVTLQPGDELRVDRGVYHHHALYVGSGVVVQFGGRIKDKPHASIHYASVTEFAKGARIKVVPHDDLDRASAVKRAHWLVENPPPTAYNVLGYNCEHVARWCATGKIGCSQAKNALTFNSLTGFGNLIVFSSIPLRGLSECCSYSSVCFYSGFRTALPTSSNSILARTGLTSE